MLVENTSTMHKADEFVRGYLRENLATRRLYHNYEHAREVAEVALELVQAEGLDAAQQDGLLLAAWFHDTGYAYSPESVADGSVSVLKLFAEQYPVDESVLENAESLIRFIHSGKEPETALEAYLYDANNSYIGRKRFFDQSGLRRVERETFDGVSYSMYDWNRELLDVLMNHKFWTAPAQQRFADRLYKNITKQRELTSKAFTKTTRSQTGKEFGRGVDTLFRITLRNHINLSRIADGKANMIISINTLVLSIIITAGAFGFSFDQLSFKDSLKFIIPVVMLMVTAITTIVIAVISALPKVATESFDMEDVKEHRVSILFFGNFLQISKDQFVEHLRDLKSDQEALYDDLARDLYNLGGVLKRKYRLLAISYRVFIIGMIMSFLAFLILYAI